MTIAPDSSSPENQSRPISATFDRIKRNQALCRFPYCRRTDRPGEHRKRGPSDGVLRAATAPPCAKPSTGSCRPRRCMAQSAHPWRKLRVGPPRWSRRNQGSGQSRSHMLRGSARPSMPPARRPLGRPLRGIGQIGRHDLAGLRAAAHSHQRGDWVCRNGCANRDDGRRFISQPFHKPPALRRGECQRSDWR